MTIMVYEKSTLGFMEFTGDKRTLGVRERQVLLLVNGVRNLDDLEKFFKKELLLDIIRKLEIEGYIHRSSDESGLPPAKPAADNAFSTTLSFLNIQHSKEPICPVKMATIKTILLEAADDYLGIMGREIKSKIEACNVENGEDGLRQCISSWHMAMRESKLGRESASFLMQQIYQTLEGKIVGAENAGQPQH